MMEYLKNENENYFQIVDLIKSVNPKIEIFITKYKPKNLNQFKTDYNFLIFSVIVNHDIFKDLLKSYDFKIVKEIIFPDHYEYTKNDIENIKRLANKFNAKIITTEKDYVKIKDFNINDIRFLEIDLEFEKKENLLNFIKKKINK